MMKTMDGKHASTLAILAMCRHQRDKYAKKANKELVATLPEELRPLGQAILDGDKSNLEAAAYIAWNESLRSKDDKRGKRRGKLVRT
jgi:hypothetical protein